MPVYECACGATFGTQDMAIRESWNLVTITLPDIPTSIMQPITIEVPPAVFGPPVAD